MGSTSSRSQTVKDQDWYDCIPDTPLLFPLFNEQGDLRHHIKAQHHATTLVISDGEPTEGDDEFDDAYKEPLEEELSKMTIDEAVNRGVYKANLHQMVKVSMTDTFNIDDDTPELIANPKRLHPVARDYDSMWLCFAWLPMNVIKKTFKAMTPYAQMPFNSVLHKQYNSPNLALNVMHYNEPVATDTIETVATDTIESDMPAIDGGEKYALISISTKTRVSYENFWLSFWVLSWITYCMRCSNQAS